METRITATQLARSLSDVLNRVRYRGERFIVERNGEPLATLGPAGPPRALTGREFLELLRHLPRPDDRFADDLEEIQRSQPMMERDRWESS